MNSSPVSEKSISVRWSALYASLYQILGQAFTHGFGDTGEVALREAIHDYGSYRASQVRREHQERGLELNLANMMNFGDMPNTDSLESDGRTCTPAYFGVTVNDCTLFNSWKDGDGIPVGRIYCEEVHQPLYCEYAEGVTLDMPEFMTKGDGFCTFVLTQPGAPETAAPPLLDEHPEAKVARLYGLLYQFLARKLLDTFGDEGASALRAAIREHVQRDAESLKRELSATGHVDDVDTAVAGLFSSIAGQAVLDAFREMEEDELRVGSYYLDGVMG